VHLALDRLAKAGCFPETIVVGVWSNGKLHRSEYFPQKFLQLMPAALRESVIQQRPEGRPGCNGMVSAAENPFAVSARQAVSGDSAQAQ